MAKWVLASYLVIASNGGVSAMELMRQMGSPATRPCPSDTESAGRLSMATRREMVVAIRRRYGTATRDAKGRISSHA